MCPNSQLLSAYIDGELPPKYEKQVREHIENCQNCANTIEGFSQIRDTLHSAINDNNISLRTENSWNSIQKRLLSRKKSPLLLRNLRIPIPIAAMTLILCVSLSIGITYVSMRPPVANNSIAEIPTFETMEELILFLDTNQNVHTMEITLPEEPFFLFISKPTLIPEDEYKAVKW